LCEAGTKHINTVRTKFRISECYSK